MCDEKKMRDLTRDELPIIEAELKREFRSYHRTKNIDKKEVIAKRIALLSNARLCASLGLKVENVKVCM